jgi:hypothetical protein
MRTIRASTFGFALFLLLFALRGYATSETLRPDQYSGAFGDLSDIYLNDNSDWWSEIPRAHGGVPPGEFLAGPPEPQNFQILGISVWRSSPNWPQKIVRALGRATVIERGDASTGRHQICYKSAANYRRTSLIFESGECSESFYLFEEGGPFAGSDRCVSSTQVNQNLKTPAGLGLGLTPSGVVKLLGPHSLKRPDFFVYKYNLKMKRTKEEIESERREDPTLGLPDLEYDSDLSLLIRFRNGRLWYLYVTTEFC